MPQKLCDLKDAFVIEGRGVILVLPPDDQWGISSNEKIYRYEHISVIAPSGEVTKSFVNDIDFTVHSGGRDSDVCFTLPKHIKLDQIAEGSEIWLERDGVDPVLWDGRPENNRAHPYDAT